MIKIEPTIIIIIVYCIRSEMVIAVRYLLGKNRTISIDFELKNNGMQFELHKLRIWPAWFRSHKWHTIQSK